MYLRLAFSSLLLAGLTFGATSPALTKAIDKANQKAAALPPGRAQEFRLLLAQALQPNNPQEAQKLVQSLLIDVRANPALQDNALLKRGLTTLAPKESAEIYPAKPSADPTAPKPTPVARPTPPAQLAAISKKMGEMRGLPTDEDRAKLVLQIVADIRALPADQPKLGPVSSLGNLVTEGDLGKEALTAVVSTMGLALKESQGSASNYMELARLVRYEQVDSPMADPQLDAANAVLDIHDLVVQETGFSLTGMGGKTYTLASLKGKVVLLNFWATWCPPCRREMPDMEKLSQRFGKQGLVVLAVSDEKRETVEGFLAKQAYTFPVVLDPERKVNDAYGIGGIPNSFVFDRNGKLVAQSIDMRTERQFLEMFKAAGLQ